MKKRLLFTMLCIVVAINAFAEANYVYHERTTNNPGCGPNYVSNLTPSSTDAVVLAFKVEFQFYTNQACIYYTTDGSIPAGSFGTPTGNTQVLTASYNCTFSSGGTVDVATGTIPAQPSGKTVKYIISAWNSGGGSEIFANGPGSPCNCGTPTNNAALATVFSYTVSGVLPITFGAVTATQKDATINVAWQVLTESNITKFEVEKSLDGVIFNVVNTQLNTTANQYNWIDETPTNGNIFYRIKALGKDGDITFSPVVRVSTTNSQAGIGIFPNPVVNNSIHLQMNNLPADSYVLDIYNSSGQNLYTSKILYNGGSNAQTIIPTTTLLKGIYQLRIKNNQSSYNIKLFVQ